MLSSAKHFLLSLVANRNPYCSQKWQYKKSIITKYDKTEKKEVSLLFSSNYFHPFNL